MKVAIDVVVDVDAWKSAQHFRVAPAEVESSVQAHLAGLIHSELERLGLGLPPDDTGGAVEFRDDDTGYLAWLAEHRDGYLINIARTYWPGDARVHRADCRTLGTARCGSGACTGPYVKICARHLPALERWANLHVSTAITPCGICRPGGEVPPPDTPGPTSVPAARYDVDGPTAGTATVEAWADEYIRFERRPEWQDQLRDEIRRRCGQLKPSTGQVLHAAYFGDKPNNADIENLLLYNIDSFRTPGRHGIRFEHGVTESPAAAGGRRVGYCYTLVPRSSAFEYWQQGRTLASFDWADLGAFVGGKKLAQVWLALARGGAEVAVSAPGTPFAVKVEVRPPLERQPVWGGLVKGVIDGVVCAFQAHTDTSDLPEVVARLAKDLPASPEEIERCLLDQRRAVLGVVPHLVSRYGAGVKWDPADHLCVAGEVLAAEPVDSRWAIRGELVELRR
jgi:hypothetical protein